MKALVDAISRTQSSTYNIILPGKSSDDENAEINSVCEAKYMYDDGENETGPDCHLCGQEIYDLASIFTYKGTIYNFLFKDDISDSEGYTWRDGMLQCIYCFNFFHKNNCNVSMSDYSYCKIFLSKNWACPTCVPIFKSKSFNTSVFYKPIDFKKVLLKLVKVLNPLRDQLSDMYFTTIDFKCKYLICISMLENGGIG